MSEFSKHHLYNIKRRSLSDNCLSLDYYKQNASGLKAFSSKSEINLEKQEKTKSNTLSRILRSKKFKKFSSKLRGSQNESSCKSAKSVNFEDNRRVTINSVSKNLERPASTTRMWEMRSSDCFTIDLARAGTSNENDLNKTVWDHAPNNQIQRKSQIKTEIFQQSDQNNQLNAEDFYASQCNIQIKKVAHDFEMAKKVMMVSIEKAMTQNENLEHLEEIAKNLSRDALYLQNVSKLTKKNFFRNFIRKKVKWISLAFILLIAILMFMCFNYLKNTTILNTNHSFQNEKSSNTFNRTLPET